jgi:hypothetical protein
LEFGCERRYSGSSNIVRMIACRGERHIKNFVLVFGR